MLVTKGYNSPWGCKEWDTTEYTHTHTHTHTMVSSIDMVPILTEPSFIIDFTKSRWRRQWQPTPVLLPRKSHGWRRSLVGRSPWGLKESDTTELLHFHFSLSCIGEGNGNPLQCSCLENPRDGGAWWTAVYGVAQSRTWLKRLSSSRWEKAFDLSFSFPIRDSKENPFWFHRFNTKGITTNYV